MLLGRLGQFVPAALDLYQHGWWVPHSIAPNVHPPGLMLYLAAVWRICGYSIAATRVAMLLVASAAVFVTFLLAIRLCQEGGGAPAFSSTLLLLVSPLFYTQSMLAQLDLPATLFTAWALLLFLEERYAAAALVSVVLVLVKETGIVVPLVFAAWLVFGERKRTAAWFALPAIALAAWIALLAKSTGHLFGNSEFTEYNLFFPLNPLRIGLALLRRFYYLFIGDFHWIGWAAVLPAWRSRVYAVRPWRIAGTLGLAQVLLVSLLGGATLERYLLPVLPLAYIAMAAAWSARPSGWMRLGQAAMVAGLLFSLFWNPPYPYPYENNLAMVDFVRLHHTAARFLERNYAAQRITTAWPLSAELRQPEFGYVDRGLAVNAIPSFGASAVRALPAGAVQVFVLYSREWARPWDVRRLALVEAFLHRFYRYEPQVPPAELERRLGLMPVARWDERGQWVAVYAASPSASR